MAEILEIARDAARRLIEERREWYTSDKVYGAIKAGAKSPDMHAQPS